MTDSQIAAAVTGIFVPWLIAVIQQRAWAMEVRYAVAFVTYVVVSLGVYFFANSTSFDGITWRGVVRLFAPLFIAGVSSFNLLWRRAVAPAIEAKTTVGAP